MDTMTIGQVAERTGFSASSLRYYEGIGLLVPTGRSDAGYRLYDETTVGRLAFIARAKQLGCTLDEITDLISIWDGERCGPVQRRFHDLVTTKIAETQQHLADLSAFAGQLRAAAAQLSREPTDGPCSPDCACLGEPVEAERPVVEPPIACSLPAGGLHAREHEWADLLVHVAHRSTTADGALRLGFDADLPFEELARLVAAEQRCCAFFAFTIRLDATGVSLEVRAPADAQPMITTLFGQAA